MNLTSSTQEPGTIAIARVWLTFSLVAFGTALVASILDGDHLLRSDDPYIVGFLVGGACTLFSFTRLLAGVFGGTSAKQWIAYFVTLVVLSGCLIVWDLLELSLEGSGLGILFGTFVGLGGLLAFPIQILRLNMLRIMIASLPGILFLFGFVYVCLT